MRKINQQDESHFLSGTLDVFFIFVDPVVEGLQPIFFEHHCFWIPIVHDEMNNLRDQLS